jgi:serine/threonine protein kinase
LVKSTLVSAVCRFASPILTPSTGVDKHTGKKVAIKVESIHEKRSLLASEYRAYRALAGQRGIPAVYWFGAYGDQYRAMVLDLLGASLGRHLANTRHRRFSSATVFSLAVQLLSLIEHVHSKSFLHRDIKPANLLTGIGNDDTNVYMIDFGLAKTFVDPDTGSHIYPSRHSSFVGTPRYASVNAHECVGLSNPCSLYALHTDTP